VVFSYRVSIGDNSLLGDLRWGRLFGIDAEFIAAEDVKVHFPYDINTSFAFQAQIKLNIGSLHTFMVLVLMLTFIFGYDHAGILKVALLLCK
jgi:hypothetical protein